MFLFVWFACCWRAWCLSFFFARWIQDAQKWQSSPPPGGNYTFLLLFFVGLFVLMVLVFAFLASFASCSAEFQQDFIGQALRMSLSASANRGERNIRSCSNDGCRSPPWWTVTKQMLLGLVGWWLEWWEWTAQADTALQETLKVPFRRWGNRLWNVCFFPCAAKSLMLWRCQNTIFVRESGQISGNSTSKRNIDDEAAAKPCGCPCKAGHKSDLRLQASSLLEVTLLVVRSSRSRMHYYHSSLHHGV